MCTDYCWDADAYTAPTGPGTLTFLGWSPSLPIQNPCEGDCDNDSDCEGDMKCKVCDSFMFRLFFIFCRILLAFAYCTHSLPARPSQRPWKLFADPKSATMRI